MVDQMMIELNGEARSVPSGTSLAVIVSGQGRDSLSIATAVNGEFVARGQREDRLLEDGDIVLFFSPMVGG